MMVRYFDEELQELKRAILRMGLSVASSMEKAIDALKAGDLEAARRVIESDKEIDEMELAIDGKCVDLLALRQPAAVDLRYIAMVMKVTTDLERVGDLAVDIAQRVQELEGKPLLKPLVDIPKMTLLAKSMVRRALESFCGRDVELAKQVIRSDNEVDRLRNLVVSELINDFMARDALAAPRAVPLLLVARHLERICDYATNIAEDVIYVVNAEVVKHHPEKL